MKTVLVFFFLIFSFVGKAQNLVVNGDFELYDQCPQLLGSVNGYVQSVYNPHAEGTTDYFNACDVQPDPCIEYGHVGVPLNSFGVQEAYNGNAYMGICLYDYPTEYREYIVLPLSNALVKDSTYAISFAVSKAEAVGFATDNIMIAFTTDPIPFQNNFFGVLSLSGYKMASFPILNTKDWVLLNKYYRAKGSENYLVIGNFLTDSETTLVEANFEPFICSPTSYSGSPLASYYYVDGVSVISKNFTSFFPNVFTPNDDSVNDYFNSLVAGYTILNGKIINRWGNVIYEFSEQTPFWDGKFQGEECEEGVYFYSYLLEDDITKELIEKQGSVSLFR